MEESLIICPRCEGNACSKVKAEELTIWNCFGCGYTSNTLITPETKEKIEAGLPELYKDLVWVDKNGHAWYPNMVMLDDKAMVFAEGKSIEDWKWSAVKSKDGRPDMTSKKEFEQSDFMEALDYINYFKQ